MILDLFFLSILLEITNGHIGPHSQLTSYTSIEHSLKRSNPSLDLSGKYKEWLKRAPADPCKEDQSALTASIRSGFPAAFAIAKIPAGDKDAQDLWTKIQADPKLQDVLAIKPKGSPEKYGDFSKVKYDFGKDPDCWWSGTTCKKPKAKFLPDDTYTCAEPRTWGLTFDDGPSCSHDRLYDFLKEQKQLATMFFIGGNVLNLPKQAQRAAIDGHQLCHHTWSHNYMTSLSNDQLFAELYYPIKAIKQVVGVTVKCWRPPFGDVDDRVRGVANALGLDSILWDNDTFDWEIDESPKAKTQVVKNFQMIYGNASDAHGTVVLDHEMRAEVMDTFLNQYPNIAKNFKQIVPVATCINETAVYRDVSLSYPTFDEYTSGKIDGGVIADPKISNAKLDLKSQAAPPATPSAEQTPKGTPSQPAGGNQNSSQNTKPKDEKAAAASIKVSWAAVALVAVAALFR